MASPRSILILLLGALASSALAGCSHQQANGRPWVHKVYIEGAKKVSPRDIKGKIATQATSWIPFMPKKYLDHPFMIDADRDRLMNLYQSRGYFSARVVSADVTPYKGRKDAVNVTFNILEGPPTYVADVKITGLDDTGALGKRIEAHVGLKRGMIFQQPELEQEKARIERVLKQHGYAWAEVKGEAQVNRDARTAQVEIRVDHGRQAVFGTVRVEGTQRTNPRRLAYHTGLRPGVPFTQEKLDEAQGRIYDLGMFSAVKMEVVHNPQRADVADVVITVAESTFNALRLGGGFGFEALRTDVHLRLLYTRYNWLGGLRTLQLTGKAGYATIPAIWSWAGNTQNVAPRQGPIANAMAQLTQPDILGPYSSLKVALGFDLGLEYPYNYYGPRTQIGLQRNFWANRINVGVSHKFFYTGFWGVSSYLTDDPQQAQVLYGYVDPYLLGYFQEDFTLDLRDRQLDARKGGYLNLTVQEGGNYAGGKFWFEKIQPDVRGYLPLGSRVVVAARLTFGQIFVQGDLSSPITERFYLGGPNSHRGFNYARLSPQICAIKLIGAPYNTAMQAPCTAEAPENFQFLRVPIGGDQMLLFQAEVRVKLFKLFGGWFSFAGFADGGDVALPNCTGPCTLPAYNSSIDITNLHWAVGPGLRYQTVIGTIRFDLGIRLNRLEDVVATDAQGNQIMMNGMPVLQVQNPDPGARFAYHISIGEAF